MSGELGQRPGSLFWLRQARPGSPRGPNCESGQFTPRTVSCRRLTGLAGGEDDNAIFGRKRTTMVRISP